MISVAFFTTYAKETTYQVELASVLDEFDDISVTVYVLFGPQEVSHDVDIEVFDSDSRFAVQWLRELYRVLRSGQHDIFHTHPAVAGSLARVVATAARFEPIVSTEHTTHEWYGSLKRLVAGSTIGLNDVVVTNSQWTYDSLRWWEKGLVSLFGTEPIVIHNGIDIDAIEAAATHRGPDLPDGFLVGTVGRMVAVKNHRVLLRAGAELVEAHDDVSLVLVGDGEERDALETLATDLGIDDRVVFIGHLTRSEVYALLHHLDVFAFPSEHEGFGNAAVEAMAAGVPVVCNDIPALREVVGDAGRFVSGANPGNLAEAIESLYRDETERERLANAVRVRASKFTIQRAADRHAALYRELVSTSTTTERQ
jgi:glycosyltransferase involved in cell wall biosynthesis